MLLHMDVFYLLLCSSLFVFYPPRIFCHNKYLYETLHPPCRICEIPRFIVMLTDFLCDATCKFPWDDTSNTPCLTGTHTHISIITKMDSLLRNKGAVEAHINEALNMDLG